MRFLSNAHTHTPYCDGKSSPQEMIREARRLGFVSLGFSGHGDQGFDFAYSMSYGKQEAYERQLRAMQEELSTGEGPRLWVGLEQDALTPPEKKAQNRARLDYILGSTHYLDRDFHGQVVAADGDSETLAAYAQEVFQGDLMAVVRRYFDLHVEMLLEDRPHIIGHFDLIRKSSGSGLFDAGSKAYRGIALEALERALPCGGVMEVNTGSIARGYLEEPYPSLELLGAWREMGGPVTLTSDCHDAALLNFGLDETLLTLRALGYRSVLRLGTANALWEAVEL